MEKIPHNPNEIISIVNENDKVIGKNTRKEIHEKNIIHREAAVFLINDKKEVLLQKRKDNGLWNHSSLGHFSYDETYKEGAVRELEEELGIKIDKKKFKYLGKKRITNNKNNDRFIGLFYIKTKLKSSDINLQEEEVLEVKYFNLKDIIELLELNKNNKIMIKGLKDTLEFIIPLIS